MIRSELSGVERLTCDPDVPAGRQAGETQSDFPNGGLVS